MERSLFRFIWRFSAKDQLTLIFLSVLALPFLYWTFELPKIVVNKAIGGDGGFPKIILGIELEQIPYLLVLCGLFIDRRSCEKHFFMTKEAFQLEQSRIILEEPDPSPAVRTGKKSIIRGRAFDLRESVA